MFLARFSPGVEPARFWESQYWVFLRIPPETLRGLFARSPAHARAAAWLPEHGRVLDAGCGPGSLSLLNPGRAELVGCDVSEPLLAIARRFSPRSTFVSGALDALPFEDASFDAYVALSAIEYSPTGAEPALREARRVLRRGGRALIVCQRAPIDVYAGARVLDSTSGRFALTEVAAPLDPAPPDLYGYLYRSRELRAAARSAGFGHVRVSRSDLLGGVAYSGVPGRWIRGALLSRLTRLAARDKERRWDRLAIEALLEERGGIAEILAITRYFFSYWTVLEVRAV